MDSEDSRDGSGDAKSSSSSSSSSSRSSSTDRSLVSKKNPKSPPPPSSPPSPGTNVPRSPSPSSHGPRSPSPESRSNSPTPITEPLKRPHSPDNLSEAHSDINSPENSMTGSPAGPKSPEAPKSPSVAGSNIASPEQQYSSAPVSPKDGPKSPQSPGSSARSTPASPDARSRPQSPESRSQPASPEAWRPSSPQRQREQSRPLSPSPERNSSPGHERNDWSPKDKWRRRNKAEQKQTDPVRSRSNSSQSSRSSTYNKRISSKDPATEEISDGEMESDTEDQKSQSKSVASEKVEHKEEVNLNISHEDLSDVSDLDSMDAVDKDTKPKSPPASPEHKPEVKVNGNNNGISTYSSPKSDSGKFSETPKLDKVSQEKTSNAEDGEELDFEAEEGECVEPKPKDQVDGEVDAAKTVEKPEREEIRAPPTRASSPEEGEVSDEAERRPEESEPRPVCRFYSRGACTWGISCRFLHPGVTDKGNYSMFEVVRGVPSHAAYPPPARDPAPPESAWERGLRTAKEMLRIANKRKEQDMDFEEKKLHLSVGGVVHDPDAELAYAAAAVGASPPPATRADPARAEPEAFRPYGPFGRPPPRFHPGPGRPIMEERDRYFERERGYERERAYERGAPQYDEASAMDDASFHKRRVRPSREVIVQRAEVERREGRERGMPGVRDARGEGREGRGEGREGRGDEWADPWMRGSPAARRRRPPSTEDSYSSTSSRSSRSPGAKRKRRASSSSRQRLSPSVIVRERRLATARATAMNPPAPRRRAPSPAAARQHAANPPAPPRHKDEVDPYGRTKQTSRNRKRYSRSSSSGSDSSSSSSESESESRSSSSSGSSSEAARRGRQARLFNAAARPRLNAKSTAGLAAAVSTAVAGKKESLSDKESGKKRGATSPVNSGAAAKKSVSRREELLKQLKAVEDAIARKRSKI